MLHPDWTSDEMSDEMRTIEAEIENASKVVEMEANVSWGDIFTSYSKEVLVGLSVMSLTALRTVPYCPN